jgi:methylmalonyl-CoA mutase
MLIQQCQYEEKGLSFTKQVALILAELSSILKKNNEAIISNINIKVSVGVQILPEIAKLNALQILTENLVKCYFPNHRSLPSLSGLTTTRYYTSAEPELNLIRQSLQCFIFEVANIKNMEVIAFDGNEKSKRISQNIIALLEEEAKFKTIKNSFVGAEYIEKLSDEMAQQSWTLFQEIENKGGFESFVNSGSVELWISEDNQKEIALFKEKKKTLVGVNKYNSKENGKKYSIEKEL